MYTISLVTEAYNNQAHQERCYLNSEHIFFLNTLDLNTTNITKDIFIIPIEDIQQK